MRSQPLPIGLTMGDAAGIGPELIVKLFAQGLTGPTVVYGDARVIEHAIESVGGSKLWQVQSCHSLAQVQYRAGCIPVINRWQALPPGLVAGQLNAQAGRGAYEYLCHA